MVKKELKKIVYHEEKLPCTLPYTTKIFIFIFSVYEVMLACKSVVLELIATKCT